MDDSIKKDGYLNFKAIIHFAVIFIKGKLEERHPGAMEIAPGTYYIKDIFAIARRKLKVM